MYVDDVNVYLCGFVVYVNDFYNIFMCICIVGFKLKVKKCKIGFLELVYLWYVVFVVGLCFNLNKIYVVFLFFCLINFKCV